MKYRTLDSVAFDLCSFHLGDPEGTKKSVAVRALRAVMDELSLHVLVNVVSEFKAIAADYTISMPAPCMDILKVGVMGADNRIRIMGRDNLLRVATEQPVQCSCESSESSESEEPCPACTFHWYGWGSGAYGEVYGYRPPQFPNGVFRYNKQQNRIEFGSGYDVYDGSQVLVEYQAALEGEGYNLIPSPFVVALTHKAAAMLNSSSRPGVAAYNMQEFRRAYNAFKAGTATYSLDDLIAAIKGESMSSPKF